MKILILAEHIEAAPWSESRWAVDLSRALVARGHEVTLACDSTHDEEAAAPATLLVRRQRRRQRERHPLRFVRWAGRLRRTLPHDVSLSLSRLVAADARLPIGEPAARLWWSNVRSRSPLSAVFEAVQHPHLPGAVVAERAAAARGVRTLRIGGPFEPPAGSGLLGFASRFDTPDEAAFEDLRRRTRAALGLSLERPVVLFSATHPERPGLAPMLEAFAALRATRRELAPVLLVAGGAGYTLQGVMRELAADGGVRHLGATSRIDAAVAAADLVAAPLAGRSEGDTGRFIADALRLGRPVLAPGAARGAELLAPLRVPGVGGAAPGHVIARPDVSHWRRALQGAMSERWRAEAAQAAAIVGRALSLDALAARLEHALDEARGG